MDDLRELATELGTPGFQKLYKAARKKNIDVSKTEVKSFLAKQGQKQIFRPLPQSKGKTVSEEPGYRAQMDLIDLKYSKSQGNSVILVVIDVFSRKVYARPVSGKTAGAVALKLRQILNEMPRLPAIISTDKGNEWTGSVEELLEDRNIIHRTKREKYDVNVLAVVDRVIQNIKLRLAESLAENPGEWAERLPEIIQSYNKTENEAVHDAPKEIGINPIATFMVQQDNAKKLQQSNTFESKKNSLGRY